MLLIFLDFDGVLNSVPFMERLQERLQAEGKPLATRYTIDPVAVELLNGLIEETGAKVVVSSSWRKLFDVPELQAILVEQGFRGNIVDVTPDLSREPVTRSNQKHERGHEIEQ